MRLLRYRDILTAIEPLRKCTLLLPAIPHQTVQPDYQTRGQMESCPLSQDPSPDSPVSMSPVPAVPVACGKESCVMSYGEELFLASDTEISLPHGENRPCLSRIVPCLTAGHGTETCRVISCPEASSVSLPDREASPVSRELSPVSPPGIIETCRVISCPEASSVLQASEENRLLSRRRAENRLLSREMSLSHRRAWN